MRGTCKKLQYFMGKLIKQRLILERLGINRLEWHLASPLVGPLRALVSGWPTKGFSGYLVLVGPYGLEAACCKFLRLVCGFATHVKGLLT